MRQRQSSSVAIPHRYAPSRARPVVLLALPWHESHQQEGIFRYAHKAGWTLEVWHPGCLSRIKPQGILCQWYNRMPELLADMKRASCPLVDLRGEPRAHGHPTVIPDHAAAGAFAAQHLIDRGFRTLLFLGGDDSSFFFPGFRDTVQRNGCHLLTVFDHSPEIAKATGMDRGQDFVYHNRYARMRQRWVGRYFGTLAKPVGVFADYYIWATDLIEGCLAADIHVPEQIGVVTVLSDDFQGSYFAVPTTAVVPDYDAQGYRAAELLDRIMHGEKVRARTRILVPYKNIVPRDSTMVHASSDLDVARATRFIMQHLHRNDLCVAMVLAGTGTARRTLYRAFMRHLGKSVAAYIEHLRIHEARQLLITAMTATAVAQHCGFTDIKHFRRALSRVTGLTPSGYREMHGRN